MPKRLAALALVSATALGACDPGYNFWIRNQSELTVLVQFIDTGRSGTGFVLRPKQAADGFGGIGDKWTGTVRVVREDCTLVWDQSVSESRGGIDVAADLTVQFVRGSANGASPPLPTASSLASETGSCLPGGVEFRPVGG